MRNISKDEMIKIKKFVRYCHKGAKNIRVESDGRLCFNCPEKSSRGDWYKGTMGNARLLLKELKRKKLLHIRWF